MTDTATTETTEAPVTTKAQATEAEVRAKLAKLAEKQAALNADLLERTNPELRELSERLAAAKEAHKPFNRLIILRRNRIETAERKLQELREGRFNEKGDFDVVTNKSGKVVDNGKGLKQLLAEQAAAAEKVAAVMSEIEAARVRVAAEASA